MLPKRYTQEVCHATQEVYPRGMSCYPRGMDVTQEVWPIPLALRLYTSWTACAYLLHCTCIPLGLHYVTQEVWIWCDPRGIPVTQEVWTYLLGNTCHTSWVVIHTSWVSLPYLLGHTHALQEVWIWCDPRGIPKRYDMRSKRYNHLPLTYLLERISYLLQVSIGVHTSWVACHMSWAACVYLLGCTSHTSWNTLHTSWRTSLGSIPLGLHHTSWSAHSKRYECNPRGIPYFHTSWVYLLGHTPYLLGCKRFYRCIL